MGRLHQAAVRGADVVGGGTGLEPQHLVGLGTAHWSAGAGRGRGAPGSETTEAAGLGAFCIVDPAPHQRAQQEPHGLGHAIWCARAFIGDDPFAILLPDDLVLAEKPCIQQLAEAYAQTGGCVVAVVEVPRDQTNRYGILATGRDDGRLVEVKGLVEKPAPKDAPSNLSIIGRYVLLPEVIGHLARMERGAGNEVQLTDAMAKLIGHVPFHGLRYEGHRFDCGDKIGFLEAQIAYALKRPEMAQAVRSFLKNYA